MEKRGEKEKHVRERTEQVSAVFGNQEENRDSQESGQDQPPP